MRILQQARCKFVQFFQLSIEMLRAFGPTTGPSRRPLLLVLAC